MNTDEIIRNEQVFLRAELQELKRCQLQYFITSVGGTGIIFGLIDKSTAGIELLFLTPLIILIPCWWTFFDKATTITRLVGYTMCLENQLSSPNPKYIGYETALKKFRNCEDEEKQMAVKTKLALFKRARIMDLLSLLVLHTRHRYWMINWYTFFALALICCLLPVSFGLRVTPLTLGKSPWYLACLALALSTLYTSKIVFSLTYGKYSYGTVFNFWKDKVFRGIWCDSEKGAA